MMWERRMSNIEHRMLNPERGANGDNEVTATQAVNFWP
jgi:hypothetical protein